VAKPPREDGRSREREPPEGDFIALQLAGDGRKAGSERCLHEWSRFDLALIQKNESRLAIRGGKVMNEI
jgi:hypothetical protein